MSVKKLEWDSNFFNKKIGRLDADIDLFKESDYLTHLKKFDIVYISSPKRLNIDCPLMDIKVTYSKTVQKGTFVDEIIDFDKNIHDYNELLELAYLSGHESRFLKDPSFGLINFKRLYKKWIDNSLADKDTRVLIYLIGDVIGGFVTIRKNIGNAQIGLIAVHQNYQGRGIGKKLISATEYISLPERILIVPTQEKNITACKFYESLGFEIMKKEFIYHYANNTI